LVRPQAAKDIHVSQPTTNQAAPVNDDPEADASRREIIAYAVGNVESSIANQFINILKQVLVVALLVNPLLIGLILSLKTLWDACCDPIMAHITDNARTRWGRRRPFILVGGITRSSIKLVAILVFPATAAIITNHQLEARNTITTAVKSVDTIEKKAANLAELAATGKPPEAARSFAAAIADARAAAEEARKAVPVAEADLALKASQVQEHAAAAAQADANDPAVARSAAAADKRLAEAKSQLQQVSTAVARADRALLLAEGAQTIAEGGTLPADRRDAWDAARDAIVAEGETKRAAAAAAAAAKPAAEPGFFDKMRAGFDALADPTNSTQRTIIIFVLVLLLAHGTISAIQSVPYYALGIEMCPSYNGRTRVVTYRAMVDKVFGLLAPWVPWFCFLPMFTSAMDGLFWIAVASFCVGVPTTIWMCMTVRERRQASAAKAGKVGLWQSMWYIARNPHFLKIFALHSFVGLSNGIFQQIGFYLNVYWVMGSALEGAKLGAWVSMLAWVLGLIALPVMNWACARYGKHNVLRFSIVWMSIGCIMKWFCMTPEHPYYQFVLPFFFSVGIGSVYSVLGSMMADVTDVDELQNGTRREGMFGATMSFLNKMVGTVTPLLAGAVLVVSGFDPALEYAQSPTTIFNMRLLYSFIPGVMLLFALALLYKYPLTAERMAKIKAELKMRREAATAAQPPTAG
jgi:GPH family glycoside/pentoside/hexuronide:cation symporter